MSGHAVQVTVTGGRVLLAAPYDPQIPPKARALGGRWEASSKVWTFATRDEMRVRELAREVYGTDGSPWPVEPTVTVQWTFGAEGYAYREQELRVAGRRLAWRPGRDEDVRLGDGVVITEGKFDNRGGSVRNPSLADSAAEIAGLTLEVRDMPRSVAEKMRAEHPDRISIVETAGERRAALEEERDRLRARLAELDTLLGD